MEGFLHERGSIGGKNILIPIREEVKLRPPRQICWNLRSGPARFIPDISQLEGPPHPKDSNLSRRLIHRNSRSKLSILHSLFGHLIMSKESGDSERTGGMKHAS